MAAEEPGEGEMLVGACVNHSPQRYTSHTLFDICAGTAGAGGQDFTKMSVPETMKLYYGARVGRLRGLFRLGLAAQLKAVSNTLSCSLQGGCFRTRRCTSGWPTATVRPAAAAPFVEHIYFPEHIYLPTKL